MKAIKDLEQEMNNIQEFITSGYIVMNSQDGRFSLNKEEYKKNSIKKMNKEKHPEYNKWFSRISNGAKKEGITTKEYRLKYNIETYKGDKKIKI